MATTTNVADNKKYKMQFIRNTEIFGMKNSI